MRAGVGHDRQGFASGHAIGETPAVRSMAVRFMLKG